MRVLRTAILLLAIPALAACASPGGTRDDVLGTWGEPGGMGFPHVILSDDGRIAGSDGCNRMMGDWEIDDGVITFGPIATTMMYCEGVDTSLNRMRTAERDGDTMKFFDDAGAVIMELDRVE